MYTFISQNITQGYYSFDLTTSADSSISALNIQPQSGHISFYLEDDPDTERSFSFSSSTKTYKSTKVAAMKNKKVSKISLWVYGARQVYEDNGMLLYKDSEIGARVTIRVAGSSLRLPAQIINDPPLYQEGNPPASLQTGYYILDITSENYPNIITFINSVLSNDVSIGSSLGSISIVFTEHT